MALPQEVTQEIFTVIEGGKTLGPAAEIIQFHSDNGAKTWNVFKSTYQGSNGTAFNYWVAAAYYWMGEVMVAKSAGAAMLTMEIGAFGEACAVALGITTGYVLYNLTPEFWDNVANDLLNLGETINGRVVAFMDDRGILTYSTEAIEAFKNRLVETGIFDNVSTIDDAEGLEYDRPLYLNNNIYVTGKVMYGGILYSALSTFEIYGGKYSILDHDPKSPNGAFIFIITSTLPNSTGNVRWTQKFADVEPVFDYTIPLSASYTYKDRTVYYGVFQSGGGITQDREYNEISAFHDPADLDRTAWAIQYGDAETEENEALQDGAHYPDTRYFPDLYPGWEPVEFPDIDGQQIPDRYPLQYPELLPDEQPYQDPEQNPDPDGNDESVTETISDPQNDPSNDNHFEPGYEEDTDDEPDPIEPIPDPDPVEPIPDPIEPDPQPDPPLPIPIPPLPSTVDSNKLFTVYNPSLTNLNSLGAYLWDNSLIETLKKIWQNPLDGIISLMQVYATPVTGSAHNIILGYLDSGVSAPVVTQQFVTIDCGTIQIKEKNRNATDYTPYTELHIFLPFIGIAEIDTNDFMAGSINVKYHVDMYTGTCLAEVTCTRTRDLPNGAIIYTFNGNCSQQIPLTSGEAKGLLMGLISAAGAGLTVASGGALSPMTVAGIVNNAVSREMLHVSHSGNLSANAGIMGQKKPYVIITKQKMYNANSYNKFYGYPVNKTVFLGNCTGYVRVKAGRLRTKATENEKKEILEWLQEGVIM